MKKKLIPFILGLSMAVLPFTASAADDPEQDSGNVLYGNFADVNTSEAGETDLVTAIPECIMTIPRDTTIKKGALSANIGRVTIEGHYFVKPYYVEVSATRQKFNKADDSGARLSDDTALAIQDIVFDVATTTADTPSTATGDGHSAADEITFVKSGTISVVSEKSSFSGGGRAARRFWKDETQDLGSQDTNYVSGELSDIKGQENIWLRIGASQWTDAQGGKYKGSITFNAEFKDDYVTGMSKWRNL